MAPGADDVTYIRIDETRAGLDVRSGETMTPTTTTETAYSAEEVPDNIQDQLEQGQLQIPLDKAKKQTVLISRPKQMTHAVAAIAATDVPRRATPDDVTSFKPLTAPMTSAVIASYKRRPTDGRLTDIDLHVQYHFDEDDGGGTNDGGHRGQGQGQGNSKSKGSNSKQMLTQKSAVPFTGIKNIHL